MSISTMICAIIYESFLVLTATLEVTIKLAELTLKTIDAFYTAIVNMIINVMDVTIAGTVKLLENAITFFADLALSKLPKEILCANLFRCMYLLKQLSAKASASSNAFKKYFNLEFYDNETSTKANAIIDILADYDEFENKICKFGFIFAVSLDSLKSLLLEKSNTIREWINWLTKKKNAFIKLIQHYIDILKELGILDLLKSLTAYFKCVIDPNSIACTSLDTAASFYRTALKRMQIEESGDGYRFNKERTKVVETFFNNRINTFNSVSEKIDEIFNMACKGLEVKGANDAFNLAYFIKNKDVKSTWRETGVGKYIIVNTREFKKAFIKNEIKPKNDKPIPMDFVLNDMKIDERTGKITVTYNENMYVIDTKTASNKYQNCFKEDSIPTKDYTSIPIDKDIDISSTIVDPETGNTITSLHAANKAVRDENSKINKKIIEMAKTLFTDKIPEYDLVDAW